MPIFEYECIDCGNEFEHLHIGNDSGPFKCQKCGSTNIVRVFSGKQHVKYRGEGFYATDYPKVKYGKDD